MSEETQDPIAEGSGEAVAGDFHLRLERFDETGDEGRILQPYETIGRSVVLGFQGDAGTRATVKPGKPGEGVWLRVDQIGESRWLSLELELDAAGLEAIGSVFWSLTAAAAPRAAYRLIVRLWTKDGTVADIAAGTGAIRATATRLVHSCAIPEEHLKDLSPDAAPRLIMFLPLNEARYDLKNLAFAPAPRA